MGLLAAGALVEFFVGLITAFFLTVDVVVSILILLALRKLARTAATFVELYETRHELEELAERRAQRR